MQDGGEFRQFVFKMAEARRPERKRWDRFRETLDTTILGTLSTSLGVVVLVIGLLAALGIGRIGWHEQVHGKPEPSTRLGSVVIVGEILGVAGLALGQMRGGMIPPLSAVGTAVCLVQMYLIFGQVLLLNLK
jgi:hypothetical protein